jgi:putative ABC transport system substrate-binding protein
MRRRDFIAGIGIAAAWTAVARGQGERVRRVGILMPNAESDPDVSAWVLAFTQEMTALGWIEGRNLQIDRRWANTDVERMQSLAKELVDLQPDAILAGSTPATALVQRMTRRIPIIFAAVADPVGDGFVASLARPGGNLTGFIHAEGSMGGKWLELLVGIAPGIKRAAILFNPDTAPDHGSYFLPSFEQACRSLKIEPIPAAAHNDAEIEMAISAIARKPGGGLVAMSDGFTVGHGHTIILSAARNKVPAIYWNVIFPREGGLLSYGADFADIYRRSASYVDRVLRGAAPSELPVQLPTKFTMILNTKTAKALGLAVPQSILLRADEVIE